MDEKTLPTSIRIPEDLKKKLTAIAKKDNRSLNNLIMIALTDFVKKYKM